VKCHCFPAPDPKKRGNSFGRGRGVPARPAAPSGVRGASRPPNRRSRKPAVGSSRPRPVPGGTAEPQPTPQSPEARQPNPDRPAMDLSRSLRQFAPEDLSGRSLRKIFSQDLSGRSCRSGRFRGALAISSPGGSLDWPSPRGGRVADCRPTPSTSPVGRLGHPSAGVSRNGARWIRSPQIGSQNPQKWVQRRGGPSPQRTQNAVRESPPHVARCAGQPWTRDWCSRDPCAGNSKKRLRHAN